MKDSSRIPAGQFCYRIVPLQPGEVLSTEINRFGKELREYSFAPGYKEVLCPYWQRTDHGTVRCDYLHQEYLDDTEPCAKQRAKAHDPRLASIGPSSYLTDEIKICKVKTEEDADLP